MFLEKLGCDECLVASNKTRVSELGSRLRVNNWWLGFGLKGQSTYRGSNLWIWTVRFLALASWYAITPGFEIKFADIIVLRVRKTHSIGCPGRA